MIRVADLQAADAAPVAALVNDYLRQTEAEKVGHGIATASADLPEQYRREVADPATAYADCIVLVADVEGSVAGVVVVRPLPSGEAEIKRLWAAPDVRGGGIGSALLDAAVSAADGPVRLSVWDWREPVIRLYESRGFVVTPAWDDRPRLVCLRRSV